MRPFTTIAMVLLVLAAVAQACRFFLGWELVINGMMVPFWFSAVAAIILAVVAYMLWHEHGHHGPMSV